LRRCALRRGQRRLRKRRQQHLVLLPRPQLHHRAGHQPAGLLLAPRTRLDLDIRPQPVLATVGRDGRKIRQRLAGKCRRQPAAGIQAHQFAPRLQPRRAVAVGGAVEIIVVQQIGVVVGRQLHIELDGAVTMLDRTAHTGQGVFGGEPATATVRDQARKRPGRVHRHLHSIPPGQRCRHTRLINCFNQAPRGKPSIFSAINRRLSTLSIIDERFVT